jgi:hypothetical protein
VIDTYASATGQLINQAKCSILFSAGCNEVIQAEVRGVLNAMKPEFEDKYLGLPTPEGRMTRGKLEVLQAKLVKRLMMWGDLSQGGKEILIKAVAQALPTFIMGVFKLPFSLCDELTVTSRIMEWKSRRQSV